MKKLVSINAVFLLLITGIFPSAMDGTMMPTSDRLQNFIREIERKKRGLQGVAVAIVKNGKVIYKMTSGRRKRRYGVIAESTFFSLASVSKSVSSTMLAWLMENKKIDLDKKYHLSCISQPVSLRHLLSHTTGYHFSGNTEIEQGVNRRALLKKMREASLIAQPGSSYFYSNAMFSLIQEVLAAEHISFAQAFIDFCRELGTEGIKLWPLSDTSNIAYPHERRRGGSKKVAKVLSLPSRYSIITPPSAGIFASLDGMIELLKLQCGHRPDIISKETLEEFHKPVARADVIARKNRKYLSSYQNNIEAYTTLGWRIFRAKRYPNKDLFWHTGWLGGVTTFVGFIPFEDVGIVILVNQHQAESFFAITQGFKFWECFLT